MKPSEWWCDVKTVFPMLLAIVRGRYKMPWGTLVWVLICAIYLISPIDALPDVLPVLGIADDGAFVVWVLLRIHQDLAAFRAAQQPQKTIILDAEVIKTDGKNK